jgi:ribosomal protein RSM22 (predicted rRNA methylase)
VQQLSSYLNDTQARPGAAQRYMKDRRLRAAYLLYYGTANMLKLWRPFRELAAGAALPVDAPLRVLDAGCGPGTGAAGLHALFGDREEGLPVPTHIDVTAMDTVAANLAMYEQVAAAASRHTGLAMRVSTEAANMSAPDMAAGPYDLILAMNLINELPAARQQRFLACCGEQLSERGQLVLIEPALRATSRGLLQRRDELVQDGWTVYAPCFRQDGCPALDKDSDWCHDDVPWQRPPFIETLDEGMGNVKKSLKYSYLILNRHGATLSESMARPGLQRVVSERFDEKGRVWWHMCGADGRQVCQRNHRDRTPANADADALLRYDIIQLEGEKPREHDVRIPPEGRVDIAIPVRPLK